MSPRPPLRPLFWVGSLIRTRLKTAEEHYRKVTRRNRESPVEESSGNVFADLELPNAEERLAKADLAIAIAREIESRALTQAEAAAVLGVAQPDVSNLMRGRLSGYSIERLTRLLNALGRDVEIRIHPARSGEERGHLRVASG